MTIIPFISQLAENLSSSTNGLSSLFFAPLAASAIFGTMLILFIGNCSSAKKVDPLSDSSSSQNGSDSSQPEPYISKKELKRMEKEKQKQREMEIRQQKLDRLKEVSSKPDNDFTVCKDCGQENAEWTEAEHTHHRDEDCAMYTKCIACSQAVLISQLNHHQGEECPNKSLCERCDVCGLYVVKKFMRVHKKSQQCKKPPEDPNKVRCPLCHKSVENTSEGWASHLLSPPYCAGNKRTLEEAAAGGYLEHRKNDDKDD